MGDAAVIPAGSLLLSGRYIIYCTRARGLQTVAVEGQRAAVEHGVAIRGEVARRRGAAVDAGILLVGVAAAEHRAGTTLELGAALEHICIRRNSICVPASACEDRFQLSVSTEHGSHVCHSCRVEAAQVEAGEICAITKHAIHTRYVSRIEVANIQFRALIVLEHVFHTRNLPCIETAQIETGGYAAGTEHPVHVGNVGGVEIAQVKALQFRAIIKHPSHAGHLAGVEECQTGDGRQVLHV